MTRPPTEEIAGLRATIAQQAEELDTLRNDVRTIKRCPTCGIRLNWEHDDEWCDLQSAKSGDNASVIGAVGTDTPPQDSKELVRLRELVASLTHERQEAETSAEAAVKMLGRIGEATIHAGYPGGDREVTLRNVQQMAQEIATLRQQLKSTERVWEDYQTRIDAAEQQLAERDAQIEGLKRFRENAALCSDHRDKFNGRCIVCQAETRTREELCERRDAAIAATIDQVLQIWDTYSGTWDGLRTKIAAVHPVSSETTGKTMISLAAVLALLDKEAESTDSYHVQGVLIRVRQAISQLEKHDKALGS